jgi:ribosomal protein S18 acetylase RimI-like enzyme
VLLFVVDRPRASRQTAFVIVIEATRRADDIDDAAQIWAQATAARDGQREVAGLDISRPIILEVLDRSDRALLLVARTAGHGTTGFAVTEPLRGSSPTRAEVRYLGVRPDQWGQGIAERLLGELRLRLAASGFTHAELAVYASNTRAVGLYQRQGWQPVGDPVPHPRTGKPEQRYELHLPRLGGG